jgi:nucleoside-diphosphate-sugar epimerase
VGGTLNVLEAAVSAGVKKVVAAAAASAQMTEAEQDHVIATFIEACGATRR